MPARGVVLLIKSRMLRSWCSCRAYSPRLANQRDSHVLLIPSLKPIGCTLRPISAPIVPLLACACACALPQDHGDVRLSFQDRLEAQPRPKTPPAPGRALILTGP